MLKPYKILCGDGKTIREVQAHRVTVNVLPDYEFIAYREPGNAYWLVAEVLSGARVSNVRSTIKEAIASADERIRFVGIETTKSLITERAVIFAALLAISAGN